MTSHRIVAIAMAFAVSGALNPVLYAAGQGNVTIAGTAKPEAKQPFPESTAQARAVGGAQNGQVLGSVPLNTEANFSIPNLPPGNYDIELVDKNGKIVCKEGTFDMTQQVLKNDVIIDCGKFPVGIVLLTTAGVVGIVAGITAATGSPSQ